MVWVTLLHGNCVSFPVAVGFTPASGNLLPFYGVLLLGLVAAVTLGLVAFFNSKRPPGWEDAQRPGFIPKLDPEDQPRNEDNNNASETNDAAGDNNAGDNR